MKQRKIGLIDDQEFEEKMPTAFNKVIEFMSKILKENKINEEHYIKHDLEILEVMSD